jgi:hypothetical protein
MYRKSRRLGSADEIAVTASILFRVAGHPIRAAQAAAGPVASGLGKVSGDALRLSFIGTLTGIVQV